MTTNPVDAALANLADELHTPGSCQDTRRVAKAIDALIRARVAELAPTQTMPLYAPLPREEIEAMMAELARRHEGREDHQVPGMPNAICHACGLGRRCANPRCPNTETEAQPARVDSVSGEPLPRRFRLEIDLTQFPAASWQEQMNEVSDQLACMAMSLDFAGDEEHAARILTAEGQPAGRYWWEA